ncbi:hypothetical protein MD484_g6530, partial [Candolleomyces efflorescens]
MAPRKEVDTDDILPNPQKRTLAAIFTDKNNAAAQDGTFKRLKRVVTSAIDRARSRSPTPAPQASSSKTSGPQPPPSANSSSIPSRSPSIEEVEDPDAVPRNRAPRNSRHLLVLSDEDDAASEKEAEQIKTTAPTNQQKQRAAPRKNEKKKGTDSDSARAGSKKVRSETAEQELARMMNEWSSVLYAFFHPTPAIGEEESIGKDGEKVIRRYHDFKCAAPRCQVKGKGGNNYVRRYLDKGDAGSTGNMRRHAEKCWGKERVDKARESGGNIKSVREDLKQLRDGSLDVVFRRKDGKEPVKYSFRSHEYPETRNIS